MSIDEPIPIYTRFALSSAGYDTPQLGAVLYHGPVPPTSGEWYGVEWDDPARGKHSGVYEKTGVRYFTTRVEGAGSFIRPTTAGLSFGTTFREALIAKYNPTENSEGGGGSKFFQTSSNFEVEVVDLSKIQRKFRRFDKLKEVGLEWESVRGIDDSNLVELPTLEILNLSFNLLPSLEAVDTIISNLPSLRNLALNSNRFAPVSRALPDLQGFAHLKELKLNNTLVSWSEMLYLAPSLPALQHLQLGANLLNNLSHDATPPAYSLAFPELTTLNLDSNILTDWEEIAHWLSPLPKLQRLILSNNRISSIPTRPSLDIAVSSLARLTHLRHLHLTSNLLSSWSSINSLAAELPHLDSIWVGANPFAEGLSEAASRLGVIARIASLIELDGSKITSIEREDAELFYLSQIAKASPFPSEKEKLIEHPRWLELSQKYGTSTSPTAPAKPKTIASSLIQLSLSIHPLPHSSSTTPSFAVSLLPHSSTRTLRPHFTKLFKRSFVPRKKWRLVAVLQPAELGKEPLRVEIGEGEEGRELSWWGLRDEDGVRLEEV